MLATVTRLILASLRACGYDLQSAFRPDPESSGDFMRIYRQCRPYTMTSIERMYALYRAVRYVVEAKVPGDFVECGVWKGGSAMLIAYTLQECGGTARHIYLYDTFSGMPAPTAKDRLASSGALARDLLKKPGPQSDAIFAYSSLADTRHNLLSTAYPESNLHFIEGKVEDTVPHTVPASIALLRLDTDWYASTYHELTHLFPLLEPKGVLLLDDYGHWRGAQEATDQYLREHQVAILLNRIDSTGRIGIRL